MCVLFVTTFKWLDSSCLVQVVLVFICEKQSNKTKKARIGPGFFREHAALFKSYFLRAAAAASQPIPPRMVLDTIINRNTVIGTIIAMESSSECLPPAGGLIENSHESNQLGGATQALLIRIYLTQKPCEKLNISALDQCLVVTRLLLRYAHFIAGFLCRLMRDGCQSGSFRHEALVLGAQFILGLLVIGIHGDAIDRAHINTL